MKQIGIIPNRSKDQSLQVTKRILNCLKGNEHQSFIQEEMVSELNGLAKGVKLEQLFEVCDSLIVVGGDGTMLGVAERAAKAEIPVIGVNVGRLGFLADIEPQEIETSIEKLLKDDYIIEERSMLQATIIAPNGEAQVFHALNDINLTRGNFSRIVEFEIRVNGDLCDIYPADGVIASTPTGSTAYNLSAGGPIVVPTARAYIITPICPHTLYAKSIILSDKDLVQIRPLEETKDMALSMDGILKMYLTPQHRIYIESSPYTTKLIKLSDRKFFDILREKIVERR